jgi:hypothetical protein
MKTPVFAGFFMPSTYTLRRATDAILAAAFGGDCSDACDTREGSLAFVLS